MVRHKAVESWFLGGNNDSRRGRHLPRLRHQVSLELLTVGLCDNIGCQCLWQFCIEAYAERAEITCLVVAIDTLQTSVDLQRIVLV